MLRYPIRQSTDADAFIPITQTLPPLTTVSPLQPKDGVLSVQDTRKAAMEDLAARINSKKGTGRMKGKVGIITGVGPPIGIGVSMG